MKNLGLVLVFLLALMQNSLQSFFSLQGNLTEHAGYASALSAFQNYLLVGSSGENGEIGASYLYQFNGLTYVFQQKFTPNINTSTSYVDFGCSVAIEATTIVIGANAENINEGAVYVYTGSGNNWSFLEKLSTLDKLISGDMFGNSVALSGNLIAVGAPGKSSSSGVVYIFSYNGSYWIQQNEIFSPYPSSSEFGYALALFQNILVVGAPSSGSGYTGIFSLGSSVTLQENLTNSVVNGGQFGCSISFDGTTIAVGAQFDAVGTNPNVGSVYVYSYNGVSTSSMSQLSFNLNSNSDFGDSVSIYGSTLVVGSQGSLSTYVFVNNGGSWNSYENLTGPPNSVVFGSAVFLNVDTLFVCDDSYASNGIVYIFTRPVVTTQQQTTVSLTAQLETTEMQTTAPITTNNELNSGLMNTPAFLFFLSLLILFHI